MFGFVSHLLDFRQDVLSFINLLLGLLQLNLIQLQLFRLLLQRLFQPDPGFHLLLQPNRGVRRTVFRAVRALLPLRDLGRRGVKHLLKDVRISPSTSMRARSRLVALHTWNPDVPYVRETYISRSCASSNTAAANEIRFIRWVRLHEECDNKLNDHVYYEF